MIWKQEQDWKQDVESGSNKLKSVGKAMKERCVAKRKAFLTNALFCVIIDGKMVFREIFDSENFVLRNLIILTESLLYH